MKPRLNHFRKKGDKPKRSELQSYEKSRIIGNIARDIVHDSKNQDPLLAESTTSSKKLGDSKDKPTDSSVLKKEVRSRNLIERKAYGMLSQRLPKFPAYREAFAQSGIPIIYESYLATGLLLSSIISVPAFIVSLLLELRFISNPSFDLSILGSVILGGIVFASSLLLWLSYPLQRRRSFKSRLENQLAYSFGVMGALSAAGMYIDRLFESLATSESNPVLGELARRFLRDVRIFGLDSESALKEVARHSPSSTFSKMLNSFAVALRTTGSIHDLVMFESSRLLQEKRDKLKKTTGNLAVMAELYITLVVVGPIIFIVMLAIFGLLPTGGLPDPVLLINLIVFLGIPVLSAVMLILLDSTVERTGS